LQRGIEGDFLIQPGFIENLQKKFVFSHPAKRSTQGFGELNASKNGSQGYIPNPDKPELNIDD
jgi:hypothetical protein